MGMGMMLEFLIPGVKHAKEADLGAEMFGIASDFEEGFGTRDVTEALERLRRAPGVQQVRWVSLTLHLSALGLSRARKHSGYGIGIRSKYSGIITLVLGDAAFTSSVNWCAAASDWSRSGAYPYPSQCVGMTNGGYPRARIRRPV